MYINRAPDRERALNKPHTRTKQHTIPHNKQAPTGTYSSTLQQVIIVSSPVEKPKNNRLATRLAGFTLTAHIKKQGQEAALFGGASLLPGLARARSGLSPAARRPHISQRAMVDGRQQAGPFNASSTDRFFGLTYKAPRHAGHQTDGSRDRLSPCTDGSYSTDGTYDQQVAPSSPDGPINRWLPDQLNRWGTSGYPCAEGPGAGRRRP